MGLYRPEALACAQRLAQADDLIARLLGQFDWRSRMAGAYLAALTQRSAFTAPAGGLLLASEVCLRGQRVLPGAGRVQGTPDSRDYLHRYLAHYFAPAAAAFRADAKAMAAIAYLDGQYGSAAAARHAPAWNVFLASRPGEALTPRWRPSASAWTACAPCAPWRLAPQPARFSRTSSLLRVPWPVAPPPGRYRRAPALHGHFHDK